MKRISRNLPEAASSFSHKPLLGSKWRSCKHCCRQRRVTVLLWRVKSLVFRFVTDPSRCSIGLAYLFFYYLFQFCGHTWIFANMSARFLSFGGGALAGTFYFVGVAMSLCQLLSILELFHIADGIENRRLLPRFVQVMERNFLLFLIISQEEFQSRTIVCVLFYLWNILDLLRYPYELLCLISSPSFSMVWVRHTVSIPVYILSVIAEGTSIVQTLPYYESQEKYSVHFQFPVSFNLHFPYVLMASVPLLAAGSCIRVHILLQERGQILESWNMKMKRK